MDTDETNFFDISDDTLRFLPDKKIGILGAGVGGLYTALILYSPDSEFEIPEASDNVGGRLSTLKSWEHGNMTTAMPELRVTPFRRKVEHGQYKNEIMKRLAELVIYLGLGGKLRAYYYEARNNPSNKPGFYYFNGICK